VEPKSPLNQTLVTQSIVILDFGSQYTQLIARRIREQNVFSTVLPCNASLDEIRSYGPLGIILSGGPSSVYDADAPPSGLGLLEEIVHARGPMSRDQAQELAVEAAAILGGRPVHRYRVTIEGARDVAHRTGEFVPVAEALRAAEILAAAIERFARS